MDEVKNVIEMVTEGKSLNYITEKSNLTRTQVSNILMSFIKKDQTVIPETVNSSNIHSSEENTGDVNSRNIIVKYRGNKRTLKELLSELDVDLNEWEVSNVVYNEWDGMRPKDQGLVKLHQLKVSFKRINLKPNYEIPSAVEIKSTKYIPVNKSRKSKIKKALILPDMQVGFKRNLITGELMSIHDRRAMSTALSIARTIKPDRIVLLGDNLDLPQESKYPTGSEFYFTTQASAVELSWWLSQFRNLDHSTKIDYLAGNHECFSEDTEILTERGWLHYSEVGDLKVATFNKETLTIEYQKPVAKQVYDYSGEMYSIQTRKIDLLITPNHRVYWAINNNSNFNMSNISDVKLDTSRRTQYCSGLNLNDGIDVSDEAIISMSSSCYENKVIPVNLVSLMSNRQFDLFIVHLMNLLGVSNTKKGDIISEDKSFLDQLQHLLVLNGFKTSMNKKKSKYQLKFVIGTINRIDNVANKVKKTQYEGKVWDFTVLNDTLVVRRNGKVSITGNCRLEKNIMQNAISAYGLKSATDLNGPPLLSVEKLLGLDSLDIEYHREYPSGRVVLNDNLICIHGEIAKSESGATVSSVVKDARVSIIQGHIHRYEVAYKTLWSGDGSAHIYSAASFGCLCKIDPGAVPGFKAYQNWQQGVGLVHYEECGLQEFRHEFIPIFNGRAIMQDEIFESENESEIVNRIEKDVKFKVS